MKCSILTCVSIGATRRVAPQPDLILPVVLCNLHWSMVGSRQPYRIVEKISEPEPSKKVVDHVIAKQQNEIQTLRSLLDQKRTFQVLDMRVGKNKCDNACPEHGNIHICRLPQGHDIGPHGCPHHWWNPRKSDCVWESLQVAV